MPFIFQDFLAYSYSRCIYVLLTLIIAYFLYGRLALPLGNKVLFCISTFLIEACFFAFSILKFVHLYGVECGVFFLFFMYIWSWLFLLTALRVLDFFVNKKTKEIRKKEKIRVDDLCFGIVLLCGLIKSLVYYPGIISEDTAYLYYVSHSLDIVSTRSDLHSFFYTLLCALIFKINSSYPYNTISLFGMEEMHQNTLQRGGRVESVSRDNGSSFDFSQYALASRSKLEGCSLYDLYDFIFCGECEMHFQ